MKEQAELFPGIMLPPATVAVPARALERPQPKKPSGDGIVRDAKIVGDYRLWLSRIWDDTKPMGLVCMLKPSTANAERDDPTVATLIKRGRDVWGWGGFYVVNLFSLISSAPARLYTDPDPIGPDTDRTIERLAICAKRSGGPLVVAWGALVPFDRIDLVEPLRGRDVYVLKILAEIGDVYCLRQTRAGAPTHPMARGKGRIPVWTPLEVFRRQAFQPRKLQT